MDSRGGTASIAHWLNNYFRLTGEHTIDKNDPLIVEMRQRVDDLYAQGRNTVMGDEELEIMVRRCDQNRYVGIQNPESLAHIEVESGFCGLP